MTRDEFMSNYKYLTSLEYDIFNDMFTSDVINNVKDILQQVNTLRPSLRNFYKMGITEYVNKLGKDKRDKLLEIL
jgi:hypothetical protein